ncbi:aldo/keto reductase [Vulcanisaeta thermophila]|uniref:aldo/keto reductase n=1 Tax=Vulcanisaeta thermophila TaxID=867917 RepID=UPI0008538DE7|nr:aldo/keto reductase [Vulcanisaeta thermophila]
MEYRVFGRTGVKVSVIGMGTYYDISYVILSRLGIKPGRERRLRALRVGLEGGINFIDTAELYGTEELVGEAIRGFPRDELFIATKVWPTHFRYSAVIKAARASARRLGTYIDLYQLHFPNPRVPIRETMRAMEDLVDMGVIRYIGVSNFSLRQLEEAQGVMRKYEVVSIQMPYSLGDRRIERDLIPYAKRNNMAVICYYPLGHGRLVREFPRNLLEVISKNHGPKTPAQILLNWIITKHENTFPIPRASNPNHVRENLGAVGWRLSEDEVRMLEESVRARY